MNSMHKLASPVPKLTKPSGILLESSTYTNSIGTQGEGASSQVNRVWPCLKYLKLLNHQSKAATHSTQGVSSTTNHFPFQWLCTRIWVLLAVQGAKSGVGSYYLTSSKSILEIINLDPTVPYSILRVLTPPGARMSGAAWNQELLHDLHTKWYVADTNKDQKMPFFQTPCMVHFPKEGASPQTAEACRSRTRSTWHS